MKNLLVLVAITVFALPSAFAQYELDFSDPTTYSTTCGTVIAAQWTVSNDRCELLIPDLIVSDPLSTDIPFSIRINQSGNMDKFDSLVLYIRINNKPWEVDTVIVGDVTTSVRSIDRVLRLSYNDTLRIRIFMENDRNPEFWSIKSGDVLVEDVTPKHLLPVELAYFEANYDEMDNVISLAWATLSETNSSHFILSRSVDAINFEEITRISAAGNSNSIVYYDFTDMSIPTSETVYYKLTQVDFDGTSYEKDMVAVSVDPEMQMVEILSNENYFIANVGVPVNSSAILSIVNMQGQLVYEKSIDAYNTSVIIDADLLSNQIYLLNVSSIYSTESKKFYAR
ncbi:MAG: hypothetical protein C0592_10375 [Marinilabiliales bacterium]|nr:MAG: hypothetical protein C0592_10375 [Marinilabiliales bacterium]